MAILNSGKKKSTKINFLGPETARWGGRLPREGVVAEKLVARCPPSKVCLPWVSRIPHKFEAAKRPFKVANVPRGDVKLEVAIFN